MKELISKQKIKRKKITFYFKSDDASEVYVVGEFNNWKNSAHPMKYNGEGIWLKSLMLPEGKYEYKFLVNNQWVLDPRNERTCSNCFGTRNNIVNVVII